METTYYSNGKLLLSAEYAVLDGALALAVPTTYGQSLEIMPSDSATLEWQSLEQHNNVWFNAAFDTKTFDIHSCSDSELAETLKRILTQARELNPKFIAESKGYRAISKLTFPRNWGLGSSSTLLNNIAQWASVDPYTLLERTFGGSGYDIACAQHNTPILYQLVDKKPTVEEVVFQPSFQSQLYFVHLNQKQDSRAAIANYRKQDFDTLTLVTDLTGITRELFHTATLTDFESLLTVHEAILSKVLKIAPIKERLFSDYYGAIKSLGGWGGDFVLATGNEETPSYFKARGFTTVVPYSDMVL
ncbi:GYDIA family GHMP kinase [Muricauda sp. SCSIO 64092]|uniref:GYDIA family GHMP kinase n=1 Tax=Allomuricauda sp. SCSIO 64092 TaxID=2908842 RepID=UPI001FF50B6E|nr:GYDIA family GHMP kinase [Muricauda sp. SCSIO 64092]UOY08186.1 GYDIA family GHMP kinase [Muricauda sp. SCSIO 64092]